MPTVDGSLSLRLAPFDVAALDAERATVCGLSEDLVILYVNPAWHRYARDNGASWREGEWSVGAQLMDAVPDVLRPFYRGLFARARAAPGPVEHEYDCSSPETLRRCRMRVYPCPSGALVVVHSMLPEVAREAGDETGADEVEADYRDDNGLIALCSHCRRVRRARTADEPVWDWVPSFARHPPQGVSHSLCRTCVRYYYPDV
jgi:hypothetical protein